jgi:hypothetical protein
MKDVQSTEEAFKKGEHPALQNMKFLPFFFLFLWVILPSWIRVQPTKSMRTATLESIMLPVLFRLKNPLA